MDRKKRISPHASLFGTSDLVSRSRCVVIVAHSFDELIGAGGMISRLRDITVVHVTKSSRSPERSESSPERDDVCVSALALANVPSDRIIEFAISDIREPHALADLAKRLSTFLTRFRPDVVLTHPYEGGHPDHDATAFATHAALRLMRSNGFESPALFEIALHPSHDGERRELDFLPGEWHETTTLVLDEETRKLKRRMFECVSVQERNLKGTTLSREKFRRSPNYDFSTAPNAGRPAYEDFYRGMTGSEWQSVAQQALAELFPSETSHNRANRANIDANPRAHSSPENSAHTN
ncbi:MAG TPA: PIG-L family deacetylase [Pyrinomonadaceae bacterium]|nr:PIG-L family deacetylase [Pyrinomonadaceae bacterium]